MRKLRHESFSDISEIPQLVISSLTLSPAQYHSSLGSFIFNCLVRSKKWYFFFFWTFTIILNLPLSPQLYWTIECWVTLPQAQSRSAVNEGLIFRILDHSSIRFSLLAYTGRNMLSVWRRGSKGAVKLSDFVWIISETHFFLCHNINLGFLKVYLSWWLFSYFLRLYFFKSSFRFTAKLSRR